MPLSFLIMTFSFFSCHDTIVKKQEGSPMNKHDIEELRKKYIQNPPEGMTPNDIRYMNEDDLLDMDYFLHEDDDLDDDFDDD